MEFMYSRAFSNLVLNAWFCLIVFSILSLPSAADPNLNPPPTNTVTYNQRYYFEGCDFGNTSVLYCPRPLKKITMTCESFSGCRISSVQDACGLNYTGGKWTFGSWVPVDTSQWFCPNARKLAELYKPNSSSLSFNGLSFGGKYGSNSILRSKEVTDFSFSAYVPACLDRIPMLRLAVELKNSMGQIVSREYGLYAKHKTMDYINENQGIIEDFYMPDQTAFRQGYLLDSRLDGYVGWAWRKQFVDSLEAFSKRLSGEPGWRDFTGEVPSVAGRVGDIYFSKDFVAGEYIEGEQNVTCLTNINFSTVCTMSLLDIGKIGEGNESGKICQKDDLTDYISSKGLTAPLKAVIAQRCNIGETIDLNKVTVLSKKYNAWNFEPLKLTEYSDYPNKTHYEDIDTVAEFNMTGEEFKAYAEDPANAAELAEKLMDKNILTNNDLKEMAEAYVDKVFRHNDDCDSYDPRFSFINLTVLNVEVNDTYETLIAGLASGEVCSDNTQCTSGFCSNTICCNTGQCGWGAENGSPAMCIDNGDTRQNKWLSGICRNGVWKTALGGWGCSDPRWVCDTGACSTNICKTGLAHGQQCTSSSECISGNCVNSRCCTLGQCGGVTSPMCFSDGQTANNVWFNGVCRSGTWKTVLGGIGCNPSGLNFACDSGTCVGNACKSSTGVANGQKCNTSSDCQSGNCVNTYCCNVGQCGGVTSPMCFSDGQTANNVWFNGVCRSGTWKTVLGGIGCNPSGLNFACDSGICNVNKCEPLGTGLANLQSCSSDTECDSNFCSNSVCCDMWQCGWGAESGSPAMCLYNTRTRLNQLLNGVCRTGVWRTVLNGWGCSDPRWPCDKGKCVCETPGGCSGEQYYCRLECTPGQVSGCRVCNFKGTGWVDYNSKCSSGQACVNGQCLSSGNFSGIAPSSNISRLWMNIELMVPRPSVTNFLIDANISANYTYDCAESWSWGNFSQVNTTYLARCMYNWDLCFGINRSTGQGYVSELAAAGYGPMEATPTLETNTSGILSDGRLSQESVSRNVTVYKSCGYDDVWVAPQKEGEEVLLYACPIEAYLPKGGEEMGFELLGRPYVDDLYVFDFSEGQQFMVMKCNRNVSTDEVGFVEMVPRGTLANLGVAPDNTRIFYVCTEDSGWVRWLGSSCTNISNCNLTCKDPLDPVCQGINEGFSMFSVEPPMASVALGQGDFNVFSLNIFNDKNFSSDVELIMVSKSAPYASNWVDFSSGTEDCGEGCKKKYITLPAKEAGEMYEAAYEGIYLDKAERLGQYDFDFIVKDASTGEELYRRKAVLNVYSDSVGSSSILGPVLIFALAVFFLIWIFPKTKLQRREDVKTKAIIKKNRARPKKPK